MSTTIVCVHPPPLLIHGSYLNSHEKYHQVFIDLFDHDF